MLVGSYGLTYFTQIRYWVAANRVRIFSNVFTRKIHFHFPETIRVKKSFEKETEIAIAGGNLPGKKLVNLN